ncbi:Cytosol aminopeptidase [Mannheimia haemolytica]|uniref:Cytosol aminopeptidase n=1 Tax=Mannheimia haemolytica TaxID=75985 RepID=A0A378NEX5_MANHA|nr:Cytosol aminopeptidase [Mannheimia haemolytica]
MEFSVKNGSVEKQRTACLVVGVYEPRRLCSAAEQLDKLSNGYISTLLRRGDLEAKQGKPYSCIMCRMYSLIEYY